MKWIKFLDKYPDKGTAILYYEAEGDITLCYCGENNKIHSNYYYCNDPECDWIYDDCCCDLIISPNDYWMYLPEKPK